MLGEGRATAKPSPTYFANCTRHMHVPMHMQQGECKATAKPRQNIQRNAQVCVCVRVRESVRTSADECACACMCVPMRRVNGVAGTVCVCQVE